MGNQQETVHTKLKGNIAERAVAKDLGERGYNVFKEDGDLSRIDLIAEKDGKLIKIQVKWATGKNGVYVASLRKSGPNNYKFMYTSNLIDLFAIYLSNLNKVIYLPFKSVEGITQICFREDIPKNNQKAGINFVGSYDNDRILRDYTGNT